MLIDKISQDQVQARKNRDKTLAAILTTLYSEAAMIGKNDGNRKTTDDEVIKIIRKFIKNNEEVLTKISDNPANEYARAGLYEENRILENYLPKQLSEKELNMTIGDIVSELDDPSPRSMGIVMKTLKEKFTGQYDGALASKLTKGWLNG